MQGRPSRICDLNFTLYSLLFTLFHLKRNETARIPMTQRIRNIGIGYPAIVCLIVALNCACASPNAPTRQPIHLTILSPDGAPAEGATAVLLPPRDIRSFMFWGDLNPPPYPDSQQFRVGADGTISIPLSGQNRAMAVFHSSGCAEVDAEILARGGEIRLSPWGRIEGQLLIGAHAGAGQTVDAGGSQLGGQMLSHILSRTDATGHFILERVPPGKTWVGRFLRANGSPGDRDSGGGITQRKELDVQPGKTLHVTLGGTGRAIVGRLEIPPVLVGRHDWDRSGTIMYIERPPLPPMPDDVKNGTYEQREIWMHAFLKTDAGKAYLLSSTKALEAFRDYPLEIATDGAFRIEDVSPSTYQLEARLYRTSDGGELAAGHAQVVVSPIAAAGNNEPVQVVPVTMQLDNFIAVGQPAPDFSVPTLNGKTLKLSNLRGHYVLLDFWSTYCIHCIEEMPNLKAANDAFRKSGRLEIISLSYDERLQNAAAYVQAQHLTWQQCWVGDDAGQQAVNAYSGGGVPQICLIGPDGTVLAKDLRGDKINSAIAAALAK